MHVAVEKARKAAGISSMNKNYPDNPKQRGCGYWAAFTGAISTHFAESDVQHLADARRIADLSGRLADAEEKLAKMFRKSVANGVEAITLAEGWTHDKQSSVMAKIAG